MSRPRKNNADYFSHDAGMRKDGRILVLRSKFGHEGYSAFCMTLELLAEADNFKIKVDEVEMEIIAADFGFTGDKLRKIWSEASKLRLLEFDDKKLYCPKLVKRLEPLFKERKRQREKSNRRWVEINRTSPFDSSTGVKLRENLGESMQSKRKKSIGKEDRKKVFIPPSFDDFKKYFKENGYSQELANRAYQGYQVADWHDSKDKKIKNWKQKCQHVWFKEENKIKTQTNKLELFPQ